ncbi:uncharacterized protein LOC141581389 [Saimiri boliviensis]|uniref:uncharacterized protein LOC141581389 n=1 Tax=Saimiri boliviensis TaxID=27679 RepID=UPI003D773E47
MKRGEENQKKTSKKNFKEEETVANPTKKLPAPGLEKAAKAGRTVLPSALGGSRLRADGAGCRALRPKLGARAPSLPTRVPSPAPPAPRRAVLTRREAVGSRQPGGHCTAPLPAAGALTLPRPRSPSLSRRGGGSHPGVGPGSPGRLRRSEPARRARRHPTLPPPPPRPRATPRRPHTSLPRERAAWQRRRRRAPSARLPAGPGTARDAATAQSLQLRTRNRPPPSMRNEGSRRLLRENSAPPGPASGPAKGRDSQ